MKTTTHTTPTACGPPWHCSWLAGVHRSCSRLSNASEKHRQEIGHPLKARAPIPSTVRVPDGGSAQ